MSHKVEEFEEAKQCGGCIEHIICGPARWLVIRFQEEKHRSKAKKKPIAKAILKETLHRHCVIRETMHKHSLKLALKVMK